jgi:hypothetical protein
MTMRRSRKLASIIFGFTVVWVALTILALTWGSEFNWPDYYHIDHGFPLVWATHTLSTIAGPADIWQVNMTALLIDLLLWLGLMVAAVTIMLYAFSKRS